MEGPRFCGRCYLPKLLQDSNSLSLPWHLAALARCPYVCPCWLRRRLWFHGDPPIVVSAQSNCRRIREGYTYSGSGGGCVAVYIARCACLWSTAVPQASCTFWGRVAVTKRETHHRIWSFSSHVVNDVSRGDEDPVAYSCVMYVSITVLCSKFYFFSCVQELAVAYMPSDFEHVRASGVSSVRHTEKMKKRILKNRCARVAGQSSMYHECARATAPPQIRTSHTRCNFYIHRHTRPSSLSYNSFYRSAAFGRANLVGFSSFSSRTSVDRPSSIQSGCFSPRRFPARSHSFGMQGANAVQGVRYRSNSTVQWPGCRLHILPLLLSFARRLPCGRVLVHSPNDFWWHGVPSQPSSLCKK